MILSIFGILAVSNLLNTLAPQPDKPCPDVEWYDEDNCSPKCEECESCRCYAKRFNIHKEITDKIPKSCEASRLTSIYGEIQDAIIVHRDSTPGAIADAITVVKKRHGISNRKFEYRNLPYIHFIEIEWYCLIFSLPEFVSTLTAYLTASWNHTFFNMYESDAKDFKSRQHQLLEQKEHAYQVMCAHLTQIDDDIDRIIQEIDSSGVLSPNDYKYKKLLEAFGVDSDGKGNEEEEKRISSPPASAPEHMARVSALKKQIQDAESHLTQLKEELRNLQQA